MFKIIYGDEGKSINKRFPTRENAEAYLSHNRLNDFIPLEGQDALNFEVTEVEVSPEERILLLEKKVFVLTKMCQSFAKGFRNTDSFNVKLKELDGD